MVKIIKIQDGTIINLNYVGQLEIFKPCKQFNYYTIKANLINNNHISVFQSTEEDLVNKMFELIISFWQSESHSYLDIMKNILLK